MATPGEQPEPGRPTATPATAFAIWITGLPASGKSTTARALVARLNVRGVDVAVLESDKLRTVLTPAPTYSSEERDAFYRALVFIGALLVNHGVPVIFDATGNRREYRAAARGAIALFLEVYVDSPLAVCAARDPKGIYRKGRAGEAVTVPGLQATYEPPEHPDIVVTGNDAEGAATVILDMLELRGYIPRSPNSRR